MLTFRVTEANVTEFYFRHFVDLQTSRCFDFVFVIHKAKKAVNSGKRDPVMIGHSLYKRLKFSADLSGKRQKHGQRAYGIIADSDLVNGISDQKDLSGGRNEC